LVRRPRRTHADSDDIADDEVGGTDDPLGVDECPVRRVQISNRPAIVGQRRDLGVAARRLRIVDHDVALQVTADQPVVREAHDP